jgi:2-dehydropantoate 2-reductase
MRVCILGAGGLGSLIGGYFAQVGVDVTLVGRPAHVEAINQQGLRITGIRGDFLIRDRLRAVAHPSAAEGEFDYLILTVKGKDTDTALHEAEVLKGRVKVALSLQNNVIKEEILTQWIGSAAVIGSSIIEGAVMVESGKVRNTITTTVTAYFGELNGELTGRVQDITDVFNRAGMPSKAVENIVQVEWEKLVQIATASGWSVTTLSGMAELTYADGFAIREGAEFYVQLSKELLAIYCAMGYTPENFFAPLSRVKEMNDLGFEEATKQIMANGRRLKEQGYTGRTSMHEDVLRKRKTEVDFIFKPILEKAQALGIQIPTVLTAYRIIKTLDHHFLA